MPSRIETVEKHVPAWKKLGLKLKYAKEEREEDIVLDIESVGTRLDDGFHEKKRKSSVVDETLTSFNPRKKTKASTLSTADSRSLTDDAKPPPTSRKWKSAFTQAATSTSDIIPPLNSKSSTALNHVHPKLKRKSVTFTPDTKEKDGDSVKQLYNTWLESQVAEDPSFDPSRVPEPLKSITPSSSSSSSSSPSSTTAPTHSKPKKSKKAKKAKSSKVSSKISHLSDGHSESLNPAFLTDPSQLPKHPVLVYLHTYYYNRGAWKFSKARQTQLLRQVFNISVIPHSHEQALFSYVRGLQGKTAKDLLKMSAIKVQHEDEEWLNGLNPKEKSEELKKRETQSKHEEWLNGLDPEQWNEEKVNRFLGAYNERQKLKAEINEAKKQEAKDKETKDEANSRDQNLTNLISEHDLAKDQAKAELEETLDAESEDYQTKFEDALRDARRIKRERADQIRWIVYEAPKTQSQTSTITPANTTPSQPSGNKRKRKRKQRTSAVPEDDSSSLSPSSEDDEQQATKPRSGHAKAAIAAVRAESKKQRSSDHLAGSLSKGKGVAGGFNPKGNTTVSKETSGIVGQGRNKSRIKSTIPTGNHHASAFGIFSFDGSASAIPSSTAPGGFNYTYNTLDDPN